MTGIVTIIAPIILLIGTGYLAVRFEAIPAHSIPGLGRLVLYFCLPALIFVTLTNLSITEAIEPLYLIAYGLGSLSAYLLAFGGMRWLCKSSLSDASLTGLGISFSNSAFIAYPILLQMYGSLPAGAFSMSLIIENLLMLPLALLILEFAKASSQGGSKTQIVTDLVKRVLFQPVMMSIVLGLLVSGLGIGMNSTISQSLELLANAAAGVALIAIGGSLAGKKVRGDTRMIGIIAVGKLIIHPALVGLFIWLLPPFDPDLQMIAILIAAMPMLSIYPVIAANYVPSTRYASALVITTLVSAMTISTLLSTIVA